MRLRTAVSRTVALVLTGTLLLGLAACGGSGSDSGDGDTKTLRVRISGSMLSTDPFREIGSNTWHLLRQLYEGLVSLDDNLDPIPMLAEKWDVADGGKEYTFHLRKGVKFHNGKTMTAEDVKYSLEYYKANATRKSLLANVATVDAVDDSTVKVTLSRPQGSFIEVLAQPVVVAIVPKGSADDDGLLKKAVGTGPFMVENFDNEERAVLQKFPDYKPVDAPTSNFGGRKVAKVDRVEILSVLEDQTALAGIETGEYDIAYDPPGQDMDRIKAMPDVSVQNVPGTSESNLYINTAAPVVKDKFTRAAILAAIDREKLVKTTDFGQGEVTHSYVPKVASWYRKDAATYWPWDGGTAQAKKLLAKSAYKGQPVEVIAGGPESQQKNAVSIEQDLKAAGIKVKIQRLDHTTYQSRLNSGKFQIASTGTPMRTPADVLYNEWYCAHGERKGRFGYCNEDYDKKFEAAQAIQDPKKRADAWMVLERKLKDDAVIDPWYYEDASAAVQKNVKGFKVSPSDLLALWNVSKSG